MATTDGTRPGFRGRSPRSAQWASSPAPGLPPARLVTSVDHKRIGIMYGAAALFFFLIGGFEALLIRLQLAAPEGKVLSADLYNQVYTMCMEPP